MSKYSVLVRFGSLLVGLALVSSPACAAIEKGCANDVMSGYLSELTGWHIAALEASDGGARIILEQAGEPKYLLLGVGLEGTRLHTFTAARGTTPNAEVPPELVTKLESIWDRLWKDPDAQGCAALAVTAAPVGDEVYKRLEAMIRSFEEAPSHEDETSILTWVLVPVAVVLILAVVAFLLIRRRRASRPAPAVTPPPTPAPEAAGTSDASPADSPREDPPSTDA